MRRRLPRTAPPRKPDRKSAPDARSDGINDLVFSPDAFARELALYTDVDHMFFLGAGASVSSGIPPASVVIQDWKERIFRTKNLGARKADRQRIQEWCELQEGYPRDGTDNEYGFYAEACFDDAGARRKYFDRLCDGKSPFVGYELLALLAQAEMVKAVWTTNFDGLAAKAAIRRLTVQEVGLDTPNRAGPPFQRKRLLSVALHGDYRYDALRNLPKEVASQDKAMREALIRRAQDFPLIVVGYSGRDQSVMEMLEEAYSTKGYGRLYWCDVKPAPSAGVIALLRSASKNGNRARYVPGIPFDSLLALLASECLAGPLAAEAGKLAKKVPISRGADSTPLAELRKQVREFAAEYAQIRDTMSPGDERTWKMEEVLSNRIRTLNLQPWPLLPELTRTDASAGEKLAATVVLQQRADPAYVSFLGECMKEKPFVGYHAALALERAAATLQGEARQNVIKVIRDAISTLGNRKGSDRMMVLTRALAGRAYFA